MCSPLPAEFMTQVQDKRIMNERTFLTAAPDHGMLTPTTSATRHSRSGSTSLHPNELAHKKPQLEIDTEPDSEELEPPHKKPRLDVDTKHNGGSTSPPLSEDFEPVQKKPRLDINTEHNGCSTSPPPSESVEKKRRLDTDTEHSGGSTSPLPSEGPEKPPFGCGCSKCTFFRFIEKGCPTPIPSASSFPYLDLSGLTHQQQQELKGRLRFESQKIMIRFQELVSATIKSLKRQCVPLDDLVSHVMTLGAFDPVFKEPQVPLFRYCFQKLKAADTIPKVFLVLNDYFSFFNYHIIEHIIKELGTEEDKAELQRYKDDFSQYAKRRIFECLPEFGPLSDADHADVFVKVDAHYNDCTVAEIEVFRHKLSEILCVSSQGVLHLFRVEQGCLELSFQVPSFVQHEIFPLSREQERALKDVGVIKLTCGEYQFPDDAIQEKSQHDIGKFVCGVLPLRFLYLILSHAVDEVEDFEPVRKKPQLDTDTEHDGVCLISDLHASWLLATLWQCSPT